MRLLIGKLDDKIVGDSIAGTLARVTRVEKTKIYKTMGNNGNFGVESKDNESKRLSDLQLMMYGCG